MSRTHTPAPVFPPAAPGNVIYHGVCKTPSKNFFKKYSDRYIVLKMNKDTGAPQVLEWKSTHEPSSTEPPFIILQVASGTHNTVQVRNTHAIVAQVLQRIQSILYFLL
jgi:hypothetical protein